MLLQVLIEGIETNFPALKFSIDKKHKTISIPAKTKNLGNIVIQDDSSELTVYVGNFTHWHASCYEESFDEKEKAKYIASEVTEFLTDLFNDKIVMWGSNEQGGGFYNIAYDENEQDSPLDPNGVKKYVWSGKTIS